jgi:pimeloyl-ACP methyl ester carboxylesterase
LNPQQVSAILSLDVCDQLPRIRAPTLIVAGKKDTYIPAENAEVIAKRIPNSKLIYSEKSAHMLQEEMEQISGAILQFLSG